MQTAATIDRTGQDRYTLSRTWDPSLPTAAFVMLNPSTADATQDDPTSAAASASYGALEVVNLFAFRATDPSELEKVADPIGPENDRHLAEACRRADLVLAAWGNKGRLLGRDRRVVALIEPFTKLACLGATKTGHPRHPLYVPGTTHPSTFRP